MKLFIFIIGLALSIWVGFFVYSPVHDFVEGVKKVYLQSRAIEQTVTQKSGAVVNTITDAYYEMTRMFGIDVAQNTAKEEVLSTDESDVGILDRLFEHNIALWVSAICGVLTMSLYMNLMMFLAFFFKPVTFFLKK